MKLEVNEYTTNGGEIRYEIVRSDDQATLDLGDKCVLEALAHSWNAQYPETPPVHDLMDALRFSVEAARKRSKKESQ